MVKPMVGSHPEMGEDEVYLGNDTAEGFEQTGWKTKRMGQTAYDIHGQPLSSINGLYPVFVQKSELEKAGVSV